MDLSKAFDPKQHDLITKMHADGFSRNSVVFFYLYLKRRKQNVRINNIQVFFKSYWFYLTFINDLLLWISNSELLNFADDNTISAAENTIEKLISTLEKESQTAINWFLSNEMIVYPEKFQAIAAKRNCKIKDSYPININQEVIKPKNCVKLLGVEVDNKLSFEKHFYNSQKSK